ncbi:thermonuclease family protein [Pontixanthobacter aestiaquae]|uniref:Thermonuclease family protein n=1 Tax=Pontixanthobacter aestiaquae TaxID=1509367 RepID=A0A844Z3V5_9SPHN|nr:thermonuclease family protein [Pontixanthobacter aestiaquae]MDN3646607.1 thermonuclease family protein [Pontixanthobacter aestiaquae]MXO82408.1 thermonuclease family protein [Pontixanthobacter aestiaquae]
MSRDTTSRSNVVAFRAPPSKQSGLSASFIFALAGCFLGVFSVIFFWGGPPPSEASATAKSDAVAEAESDKISAKFGICGEGPRSTCVVDGDTIWLHGTKIRIADINTPEVSNPGCAAEANLGHDATRRLANLLNEAPFSVLTIDRDEDQYGRKLRIISRSGRSLGAVLVAEGLAEEWNGVRRNWC